MNRFQYRLIASLPLQIAFVLASCGSIKEPDLRGIENVRVDKINSATSTMRLDLRYFNPNKFRVKLKNASGDAWLEGKKLGSFSLDSAVNVSPKSDFTLPVTLEVDMKRVLSNTLTLLLSNEVTLKIDGTARIGKSGITINYPLKYEGKQKLSELLGQSSTNVIQK
ncbi:MAG TPA: LEA type 2 family protein [Chitinophagaceae bacterium]|nr:LEA type 2 family protein [Chitinophagaceae bacterium]HRF20064.1 LEA type 2 family protein [Chitinophagaceae bacterium]